jgi:hypothetical protein
MIPGVYLDDEANFYTDQAFNKIKFKNLINNTYVYEAPSAEIGSSKQIGLVEFPYTQDNTLNDQEEKVLEIIYKMINSTFIAKNIELANLVMNLYNLEKDEDQSSVGINIDSLNSFYNFFSFYKNLKLPVVTLTNDCNIYASWKKADKLLSIHFLEEGNIRFVLFVTNKNNKDHKDRISGTATINSLIHFLPNNDLIDWITFER